MIPGMDSIYQALAQRQQSAGQAAMEQRAREKADPLKEVLGNKARMKQIRFRMGMPQTPMAPPAAQWVGDNAS